MIRVLILAVIAGLVAESSQKMSVSAKSVCWTPWYDRDDPSGRGDWELLSDLRKEHPGRICEHPQEIEAVTTDTGTAAGSTGETFAVYSPTDGLLCKNSDQSDGRCRDYKVRFGCPC